MSLKESVNDKYYDNFMGFFGGAENYPALKLYIHLLDDMKSQPDDVKPTVTAENLMNLCTTFICDLTQFKGAKSLDTVIGTPTSGTIDETLKNTDAKNVPYDMAVFIHDIYKNYVVDTTVVNSSHPKWKKISASLNYLHRLNTAGTNQLDMNKAKVFRAIVADHITDVKDLADNEVKLTDVSKYEKIASFKWKQPAYKFTSKTGVGTGTLVYLMAYMDTQTGSKDYQFYLSIKTSHYHLTTQEANQIVLNSKAKKQANNKASDPSHWITKKNSTTSTVGYYRKHEDPSKLYKLVKDPSGKLIETEVQVGSEYFNENSVKGCNVVHGLTDSAAVTAPVIGFNESSCSQFVLACLTSGTSGVANEKCRDFLTEKNFWGDVKKEVFEDMLPDTAIYILEKFGFNKTKVSHGTYKHLNAFVETKVWLEDVKSKITDPGEYKAISENANLMAYLGMLVNKVNNSPAILNSNYYDKPNTPTISNQRLLNSRLGKYGLLPRNILNTNYLPVDMIKNVLVANIASYRQQLGIGFLPVGMPQRGGGFGVIMSPAVSVKQRAAEVLPEKGWTSKVERNSKILKDLVGHFTSQLGEINKQISDEDKVSLDNYIKTLEDAEENLLKNIDIMYEYLNIMINYADEGDAMTEKESLTNIESFIESSGKRINKIEKGTNNLLLTIKKLSDALQVSVNDKVVYPQK